MLYFHFMNFKFLKKIRLVFVVFALSACHSESNNLPIPKDKLLPVLIDIHMVEAVVDNDSQVMKDSLTALYYPQIFEKHGVTAKDFDSTVKYMNVRPKLMHDIYEDVMKEIQKTTKPTVVDTTKKN